jgi:hypothetical protein
LFGSGENVVEIVIKKKKPVGVYLVLKELAAWVGSHIKSNRVGPFKKASLSHCNESCGGQQGRTTEQQTPPLKTRQSRGRLTESRQLDHVMPRAFG